MDHVVYFRHSGGVIGLAATDIEALEHFDREFLSLMLSGILAENERWEYINDCLHNEGITDDHIFITGRCNR